MRKISKGNEPPELTRWKKQKKNKNNNYNDLTDLERQAIRQTCLEEQFYICAYCCKEIGSKEKDCMNEHIQPKKGNRKLGLCFNNIVSSCTTLNQCDTSKDSQKIDLTPLMSVCETELEFGLNGRVKGLTDRAKTLIQVINLGDNRQNNKSLIQKRKAILEGILFTQGLRPLDVVPEKDEILKNLLANMCTPNKEGKLQAYAPVMANILRSIL